VATKNKCVIVVTHSKELAKNADEVLGLKYGMLRKLGGHENEKNYISIPAYIRLSLSNSHVIYFYSLQ